MHAFSHTNPPTSKFNKIDYNARIAAAIADLKSQVFTDITAAAEEWDVKRTTLSKRFRGKTGSREDANSYVRQRLTATQEKTLIEYINKLDDRGFHPTPQILKNIAQSIARTKLSPN